MVLGAMVKVMAVAVGLFGLELVDPMSLWALLLAFLVGLLGLERVQRMSVLTLVLVGRLGWPLLKFPPLSCNPAAVQLYELIVSIRD